MILTVTPNTAIDRAIFVRDFRLGRKTGAVSQAFAPAGKGIGVALTIHELGGKTLATGLAAGRNGQRLRSMLDQLGIPHEFVDADGETRVPVVLVDLDSHRQSTISAQSLRARPAHMNRLAEVMERRAPEAWGVVFGGSLPPGLRPDSYAALIRLARDQGLFTLLDASGEALRQGIACPPHVLKVNKDEVSVLEPSVARALCNLDANPREAASRLRERIGRWASVAAVVTLGPRGTLAVTTDQTIMVRPPEVPIVNTAGAGDALTAGLMLALSRRADWSDGLALGTAAAAAVVMTEGTGVCQQDQVHELLPKVIVEG
jgi:1-phosphofructokinase family hexose kinase